MIDKRGSPGFDLNRPTIICLLYAVSFTGITALIGVVLAYVWRGEPHEAWEESHYDYLIRTFWLGLVASVIGAALIAVLIGFFVLPAVCVWMVIRVVLSLVNAQKRAPMPNPRSLLV